MRRKGLYALLLSTSILYGCNENIRVAGYTIDREAQIKIAELGDRIDVNNNRKIELEEIERIERYITLAEKIDNLKQKIYNFISGMSGPLWKREEN